MTIGIMGCDTGVGVTHLAIALCNYCCSKQRKKVAYLELHARAEISQLIPESKLYSALKPHSAKHTLKSNLSDSTSCPCHFQFRGVDYYPHVSDSMIPALLNQGYDYLILDIGSIKEADYSEFLRCDRKLVVGSVAPWKLWRYEEFFRQFVNSQNLGEGFHYLLQMGTWADTSHFIKSHHISMVPIPFIKNPFRLEKELFLFLEELLAEPRTGSDRLPGIRHIYHES